MEKVKKVLKEILMYENLKRDHSFEEIEKIAKERILEVIVADFDNIFESLFEEAINNIAVDELKEKMKKYFVFNDDIKVEDLETAYSRIIYFEELEQNKLEEVQFAYYFYIEDGVENAPYLVGTPPFCDVYEYCEDIRSLQEKGDILEIKDRYTALINNALKNLEEKVLEEHVVITKENEEDLKNCEFKDPNMKAVFFDYLKDNDFEKIYIEKDSLERTE